MAIARFTHVSEGQYREAWGERLAEAVNSGSMLADLFAEPYAFPRALYIAIANLSWNRTARANGLRPGDLVRRL